MPVTFNELVGSPKLNFRTDGASATRIGKIAWGDVPAFINELMPPTVFFGASTSPVLSIGFPEMEYLRVSAIRVEPFLATPIDNDAEDLTYTSVAEYQDAKVTIDYDTMSAEQDEGDDLDPVPLLTHRWQAGGEFLTLPNSNLRWVTEQKCAPGITTVTSAFHLTHDFTDDTKPVTGDAQAGLLIPTIEHQITWPRVINPPFTAIRNLTGKVNNVLLRFATGKIPPETLLFLGAELKRDIMSNGKRAWELTYHFSERQVDSEVKCIVAGVVVENSDIGGWNHFWRQEKKQSGFYPMVREIRLKQADGTFEDADAKIYAPGRFARLFIAESPST